MSSHFLKILIRTHHVIIQSKLNLALIDDTLMMLLIMSNCIRFIPTFIFFFFLNEMG